jgi:hypothetical protein
MNTQPKIPIATIGLEEAHLGILEFLIAYYFKDDFVLTKHKDANEQVCIFNIKSTDDYKTLTNYKKKKPTVLFIAITKDKIDDKTIDSISFPLSPRKISDVLHHIKDKIKTAPLPVQAEQESKQQPEKENHLKKQDITNAAVKNTYNKKEKNSIPKQTSTIKEIKTQIKTDTPHKVTHKVKTYLPLASEEKTLKNIANEPYIKKNEPKQKIAKQYELVSKRPLSPSLSSASKSPEKLSNEPAIKKPSALKNKADDNKNKQITIKKDILKFVSSRSDVNLNNPRVVANLVYPTNKYLQGELTRLYAKAKRDDKTTTLDTSYGIISYNPKNHKAFVSVSNTTLQNISSIANLKGQYLLQSANDIEDKNWEDADALLWKTSIWASRGRLPAGADIDIPFILKHWPNLTRFMMTPHAMEITALWVNEPITLRKTISLLAIPQRTVFSFYSAVVALDLVIIAPTKIATNIKKDKNDKKEQQPLSKPETKTKKRKGFFSKLLNYFKPDNIEEI